MTPYHDEVLSLLRELDDIAIAITRIEAAHGPHPQIDAARRRQAVVRDAVLALTEAARLWTSPAISGPH